MKKELILYTSENPFSNPKRLFTELYVSIKESWELAWQITVRDIKSKYRQSFLGILWVFIPPIVTGFVFIFLSQASILNVNIPEKVPYPVFVFSGMVLWLLFTDSLNAPIRVVSANKSMLGKINFHREALLISSLMQVLFDFVVRNSILIAIILFYKVDVSPWVSLFPFAALSICLLGISLGIMLVPVGMLYNDIVTALPTFTQLFFFVTPIVYSAPSEGIVSWLFSVNPLSPLVTSTRNLLILNEFTYPAPFMIITITSFFILFFAWIIYKVTLPILIERM